MEVEAYPVGDPAGRTFGGKTQRNASLYLARRMRFSKVQRKQLRSDAIILRQIGESTNNSGDYLLCTFDESDRFAGSMASCIAHFSRD